MEEKAVVERPLMGEEEFKDYIEKNRVDFVEDLHKKNIIHLRTFDAVNRFKSIRRAMRRGHVSLDGVILPKRPFNNSKCKSNSLNNIKKRIYGMLKCRKQCK